MKSEDSAIYPGIARDETVGGRQFVVLLHPASILMGVSIGQGRGHQQTGRSTHG